MLEAHFRGARLIHVVADDEGMAGLRDAIPAGEPSLNVVWSGVPVVPPDACRCMSANGSGATSVERLGDWRRAFWDGDDDGGS